MANQEYEFIEKTLFFPKKGILVVGDLHIGYDNMLRQSGILIPKSQTKSIKKELSEIFQKIESKNWNLNKIVFLGDLKHAFSFEFEEKSEFQEILEFLGDKFPKENIILIKGNHDTIDYTFEGKMKDFHIEDDIAFAHGHQSFDELFNDEVKFIVMGHIHPSVVLHEKQGVKKEAYKCFLEGSYKGKEVIVLPSFLNFFEGTPVNDYKDYYIESFSIVSKKDIMKFKVHVIGKDAIYDFGTIKNL